MEEREVWYYAKEHLSKEGMTVLVDLDLDDAEDVRDLLAPPGNQLEKLKGDLKGQYSIRINDQWSICFDWVNNRAENVEIVDYH